MFVGEATIPDGERVYAIGDIHGCIASFDTLLARIDTDLEANPIVAHTLVTVGDYCDRGPDSNAVYDRLIELQKSRNLVALLGNHDERLLAFMDDPVDHMAHFAQYGGLETLFSYGIEIADSDDPIRLSRGLARALPASHRRFIESAPLSHEIGDYFFAHAGVDPSRALNAQTARDLMWIRKPFLDHSDSFGKVVIHGHTPVDKVDIRNNRINIDSSAVFGGKLSCVVLEADQVRILSVPGYEA